MLFVDDMILIDKAKVGIKQKLKELWKSTLDSNGFRLCRTKRVYVHCNFSNVGVDKYFVWSTGAIVYVFFIPRFHHIKRGRH